MGVPFPGVKGAVWRSISVELEGDDETVYTHDLRVLYKKLRKKDEGPYKQQLIEIHRRIKAGGDDAMLLTDELEELRDAVLMECVLGWDFHGIDGDTIPWSVDTLKSLLEHADYRDALWRGFERGRNWKQEREKN